MNKRFHLLKQLFYISRCDRAEAAAKRRFDHRAAELQGHLVSATQSHQDFFIVSFGFILLVKKRVYFT